MLKVSRLLKVAGFQHCVAHSIDLLLMTDSLLKVGSVTGIFRKCKDKFTALHYKSDMLERELKNTNNELAARSLLEKISEVQLIEDDVMLTEENEKTDTEVTEMEVETENRRSYSKVDKESKSI